ncbi:MAG TPA: hypothetical protein VIE69_10815 [Methylophilaceae bacterium]|jgi:hypothetical protein
MARESSNRQIHQRQVVAQQAARLMAEEGIADYAFAKRKAARQLGMEDSKCLPGNAEIESALREYQELYLADEQPEQLQQLRTDALAVMQLLQRFDPHLTGSVLDGTAGRYAQTEIHLFADSDKEVEIFLLNNKIPYRSEERYCHIGSERRKILVFVIDTENSVIRLSVFAPDGVRVKNALGAARTAAVETLINSID